MALDPRLHAYRDDLADAGIPVHMGRKVTEMHRRDGRIEFVRTIDGAGQVEVWEADEFVVSMPLRDCVLAVQPGLDEETCEAARGLRLDIPAGTAVRFEPGQTREVRLVPYRGGQVVYGFNAKVMGAL